MIHSIRAFRTEHQIPFKFDNFAVLPLIIELSRYVQYFEERDCKNNMRIWKQNTRTYLA